MADDQYIERRFFGPPGDGPLPAPPLKIRPKPRKQPPQETVRQFWEKYSSKYPGKVFTVLPDNQWARKKAAKTPKGAVQGVRVAKSYEEAKAECERDVNRIIRECRRTNQKYRDPHFDMEVDLKLHMRDCIDSLKGGSEFMKPRGVKRVTDIFENPQFYIDDPTAGDVKQGRDGDCYLMAALCGLGNMKGLIEKVCIKHDEDCQMCGVYGFVFFRDGEWQTTIIDDKLYLRVPDYDEAVNQDERIVWDEVNRKESEDEYRKTHQTGSRALYFAQCSEENETWLPLLEKAFAKAHGDYGSIDGGYTGEALEDLTGGVTSEMYSDDILDKNAFWRNELMKVNQDFLFGCATGAWSGWLESNPNAPPKERQGIYEGHAYSIMEAREIEGHRLLKLRNPWGKKEWQGKWSDGSSEWNGRWFELLNHKFGNDGIFWISYEDLLRKYQHFDRTRIFNDSWHVTQKWTSLHVPFLVDYHSTKFRMTLKEKGPVVIVLSQLDSDYFKGLEGSYTFDLQFRIETEDDEDNDYIVRSHQNYVMVRSVSTDIELDAGVYSIFVKITATPNGNDDLEELLPRYAKVRREKLAQVGMSYDLAHAKGIFVEAEKAKTERLQKAKEKKAHDREGEKERFRAQALKMWQRRKLQDERDKRVMKKQSRVNEKRRAQGRGSPRDMRFGEDRLGSLNAAQGGSLNGAMSDEGRRQRVNGIQQSDRPDLPPVIQSFSGEAVVIRPQPTESMETTIPQASQDIEQESVAHAVATTAGIETDTTGPANSVVQPLDEVIAAADAYPAPNKLTTENGGIEEQQPTPKVQVNGVDAVKDVKPLPTQPGISSLDTADDIQDLAGGNITLPEGTAPDTGTDLNGEGAGSALLGHADTTIGVLSQPTAKMPGDELDAHNDAASIASIDSFPSFDWQTELDMPSASSDSDSQGDHKFIRVRRAPREPGQQPVLTLDPPAVDDDADFGDLEPWNAVCVVGLRVYSQVEGDGVVLEVVRPSETKENADAGKPVGLDRDDPNKSLVEVEGNGELSTANITRDSPTGPNDEQQQKIQSDQSGKSMTVENEK